MFKLTLATLNQGPLYQILAGTPCIVIRSLWLCRGLKIFLGGLFMSVYRIILIRRPDIAISVKSQRRITYGLVVLEWVTLGILFVMFQIGNNLYPRSRTHFSCWDQSKEKTELEEWILIGKQYQTFALIVLQMFIVTEFVMYLILFKDMFDHNKELQNGKSLGISADNLRKRQRKNVITLSGQAFTFVVEFVICVLLHFATHEPLPFGQILIVFSYIVTSPELRQFYLCKE